MPLIAASSASGWSSIIAWPASGILDDRHFGGCVERRAGLGRQDAALPRDEHDRAAQPVEGARHVAHERDEGWVELPRPAAVDLAHRGRRHVRGNVGQHLLRRDGPEPRDHVGCGRVAARVPERGTVGLRAGSRAVRLDRRVDHDGAGELGDATRRQLCRDHAAHRVAGDDRARAHSRRRDHGGQLIRPEIERVAIAVLAVAVARQIDRDDATAVCEQRREMLPPAGVGAATVHEHEVVRRAARLAPRAVRDAGPVDDRLGDERTRGERILEPGRRRARQHALTRVSRQAAPRAPSSRSARASARTRAATAGAGSALRRSRTAARPAPGCAQTPGRRR